METLNTSIELQAKQVKETLGYVKAKLKDIWDFEDVAKKINRRRG
jgi:hypothetical protein